MLERGRDQSCHTLAETEHHKQPTGESDGPNHSTGQVCRESHYIYTVLHSILKVLQHNPLCTPSSHFKKASTWLIEDLIASDRVSWWVPRDQDTCI